MYASLGGLSNTEYAQMSVSEGPVSNISHFKRAGHHLPAMDKDKLLLHRDFLFECLQIMKVIINFD